ncbi:hypothetical protein ACWC09_33130 [Streptomyces sp. NPDC001617]
MSEPTTEVVLAEAQLQQLATAVATSLTAYFEARDDTRVVATPVAVTVTEGVAEEEPTPTEPEETGAERAEAASGGSTAPAPAQTDPDTAATAEETTG